MKSDGKLAGAGAIGGVQLAFPERSNQARPPQVFNAIPLNEVPGKFHRHLEANPTPVCGRSPRPLGGTSIAMGRYEDGFYAVWSRGQSVVEFTS